jgi:peptidoglycan hydrolase-like protein with peptidoglycan-binding domain
MQAKTLRNILFVVLGIFILACIGFIIWSKTSHPTQTIGTTLKNVFPFGNPEPTVPSPDTQPGNDGQSSDETATPDTESPFAEISKGERLRPVTKLPVSGYGTYTGVVTSSAATIDPKTGEAGYETISTPVSTVRYALSKNGFLYEAQIDDSTINQRQVTNTSVPGIYEAFFTQNTSRVFYRYWNDRDNYIETITGVVPPKPEVPDYCQTSFSKEYSRKTATAKDGVQIKLLAKFLNQEAGANLVADGVFGKKMEEAIKNYQTNNTLMATGTLSGDTRSLIASRCGEIQEEVAKKQSEPSSLAVSFLPTNIKGFSTTPAGEVFTLESTDSGVEGIFYDAQFSHPTTILDSPFGEWMPDTPSRDLLTLTSYASGEANGYLYSVNPKTGDMVKRYGGATGLTTKTSPDGKYSIISTTEGKTLSTKLLNLSTGEETDMPYRTLAEKCAWNTKSTFVICSAPRSINPGTYPDAWYQGRATFADDFWITYVSPLETKVLYRSTYTHDYTRPLIDQGDKYLFVTDRVSGTLWVLRIEE